MNKIHQLRKKQIDNQQECFYYFMRSDFENFENNEGIYSKECEMLCDAISLIRGLDEFEQRKVECVNHYDMIKRRV